MWCVGCRGGPRGRVRCCRAGDTAQGSAADAGEGGHRLQGRPRLRPARGAHGDERGQHRGAGPVSPRRSSGRSGRTASDRGAKLTSVMTAGRSDVHVERTAVDLRQPRNAVRGDRGWGDRGAHPHTRPQAAGGLPQLRAAVPRLCAAEVRGESTGPRRPSSSWPWENSACRQTLWQSSGTTRRTTSRQTSSWTRWRTWPDGGLVRRCRRLMPARRGVRPRMAATRRLRPASVSEEGGGS